MQVANDKIIAQPESLAANWTSEAIPLEHAMMLSIQLEFSGSLTGSFFLECSSEPFDLRKQGKTPTMWSLIKGSIQNISEAGDHTWNIEDCGFAWVRVGWIATSGSGSLDRAIFNAKGV